MKAIIVMKSQKEETVEKVSGNEEPAKDAFVNRMMFFYENGE